MERVNNKKTKKQKKQKNKNNWMNSQIKYVLIEIGL